MMEVLIMKNETPCTFIVKPTHSVLLLRQMLVHQWQHILVNEDFMLVFKGSILENGTLEENGIQNGSTILFFGDLCEEYNNSIDEFPRGKSQSQILRDAVSAERGGTLTLSNGASLQVEEDSANVDVSLSMSVASSDSVTQTKSFDDIEGSSVVTMYTLEPHGSEFKKPITVVIPYNPNIPQDQVGVFYMKADPDGNPIGTWTHISEVKFQEGTAVFSTTHFSFFAVFAFADVNMQRTAKVTRAANDWEAVHPGLSYRGKCTNEDCNAFNLLVNCGRGFGKFFAAEDLNDNIIRCPRCKINFIPEKIILYDTKATVKWKKEDNTSGEEEHSVPNSEVLALGIDLQGNIGTAKYLYLTISTKYRPGAIIAIDVCFAMDCTSSMGKYINAAQEQIKAIARGLIENLQERNLAGKLRFAFVGYRDYEIRNGRPQRPSNILEIERFTENIEHLAEIVCAKKAEGGDDIPEHVVGALQEATNMEWRGSTRVFVLIGDAPCHGAQYHNVKDRFPRGDPSGLQPETFLRRMVEKDINFFFLRIKSATDIMIDKFRECYDDNTKQLKIEVLDSGEKPDIMGNLVHVGIAQKINDKFV